MPVLALLLTRWNSLPRAVRVVTGAAAFVAVLLSIAAAILAHPPRIALFAAPLHPEQLSEVEERLASWNVTFTPTVDNVVVDAVRRNDLLLRLSLAGVPHPHLASTGEALATIGVLTPQAVVEAQTRAGLAGDIEAGLRGIDGIDDARVIVAPAKAPEFADESARDASASVRLRLRAGARLSREAIDGIRAFVAASVPELQPAHVTILDDGAAIVRVRAEYAGERTSERDVRRTPAGAQEIAGARRSESYDGGGKRYRRLEEGEDRGSETRELVSEARAGGLKRLSTAIFVDQSRDVDLAKVRELAAATVGYDGRRGDLLAVDAVDFRRAPTLRRNAWWLLYGAIVPLAPALIVTLGLVICVRLAMPPFASFLQSLVERAAVESASKAAAGFAPARVRSMLEQEPPHAAAAIISALPAATATAVLELYPPHEREAIVRRMQRRHSPLLDDAQELLRRHV